MRRLFLTIGLLGLWAGTLGADADLVARDEQILKSANVKSDGEALLQFLRGRILADGDRDKVRDTIRKLGSKVYREREQASQDLIARGPVVVELLRAALQESADLELIRRAEVCLQRIQSRDVAIDVPAAVVRLVAERKPAAAVETLLAFVPFSDNDHVADEVRASLAKLGMKDGKAHPALAAALADKHPVRRASAGEVLAKIGTADDKPAVRKLLEDEAPLVRWRVATALTYAKDKDAVPVLIALLPQLSLAQAWQVEDILFRLAEDKNPPAASLGKDEASRTKARDAWADWWKEHGGKADLAKLAEIPPLVGHTMIVLLDQGTVQELGPNKQIRWEVTGLVFPLDAQFLPADRTHPDDRILVAEYHGSRVTERNLKGEVLWQKRIGGALAAQRLPNGNTFIATDATFLEFDKNDKEVLSFGLPSGERIMKAMKLPNGEIVCLAGQGQNVGGGGDCHIVRLDKTGKELHSFTVHLGLRLFGGRIHMLPSGRVLIPECAENKVVEYDLNGKELWSVNVEQPVIATRLPNGNTLVTTMTPARGAVEFDPRGNEVWSYKTNTRVTRAIRR